MNNYSKEQLTEIHKLATDFTKNALGDYPPRQMCFTICYPLSLYLENLGYKNTIIGGSYLKESSSLATPHFWLQLTDTLKTIVDPTIGQFENNISRVSVGQKPKEFTETPTKFEEWFYGNFGTYEVWKGRLLDNEASNPFPNQPNKNNLDIVKLININLKAATKLYAQTKEFNPVHSDIYDKYFDCIFQIVKNYYTKKEWQQIIFIEGFNALFAKAIEK